MAKVQIIFGAESGLKLKTLRKQSRKDLEVILKQNEKEKPILKELKVLTAEADRTSSCNQIPAVIYAGKLRGCRGQEICHP